MAVGNAVIIIAAVIAMGINTAKAELCLEKIDNGIEKRGGYRWQWRNVDGRKCWFYSNSLLPREDLIWSYESKDFDSDVRVLDRKFYTKEELEEK